MITEKDLQEAIAECEGQKNPNANTCIKLAAFYTIMNNLYPTTPLSLPVREGEGEVRHSYSQAPDDTIEYDGESEFSHIINGMHLYDVLDIVDELMSTVQIVNPKLYDAVIRKLLD